MSKLISKVCAGCSAHFRADSKVSKRRKYCSIQCANNINGKLAGMASYELGVARRPVLVHPASYRLIPVRVRSKEYATAKVDTVDYDLLTTANWRSFNGYAVSGLHATRMHRLVLSRKLARDLFDSEQVDHKNHDTLDNRRRNLRLATASQNSAHTRISGRTKFRYRGVVGIPRVRGGYGWRVSITANGTPILVGTFQSAEEAAHVYDQWAYQLFGEFAVLNFS